MSGHGAENDATPERPRPPGPPGPPTHAHEDGSCCMWVRRSGMDRWRQVDHTGWDLGPCPATRVIPPEGSAS